MEEDNTLPCQANAWSPHQNLRKTLKHKHYYATMQQVWQEKDHAPSMSFFGL